MLTVVNTKHCFTKTDVNKSVIPAQHNVAVTEALTVDTFNTYVIWIHFDLHLYPTQHFVKNESYSRNTF